MTSHEPENCPENGHNHSLFQIASSTRQPNHQQNAHRQPNAASTFNNTVPTIDWLDLLEKDFDKAFVDLDLLLADFETDQVI